MPAAYTHYRFGKDVLKCLPFVYRKTAEKYREYFDIGLHGPDILFYYRPLSSNPVNQTGFAMHDRPGTEFFTRAAQLFASCENPDALKAYLYGFICHFALDSTCHPYIEKMISRSKLDHNEIETELDRYFMTKDRLNPYRYVPVQHIHASKKAGTVISPCFESVTPEEITSALRGMILSHKLLHVSGDAKRILISLALRLTGKYHSMHGLVMKSEPDEMCRKYCILLNKLYTEAVTVAASLIQQYTGVLEHGDTLSSRFSLTFGAGEKWEELFI